MAPTDHPEPNPPAPEDDNQPSTEETPTPAAPRDEEEAEFEKEEPTSWWDENRAVVILALFVVLFLVAFLWNRTVITIHSGERGVLFQRLGGTKMDRVFEEGLRIIWPIDTMHIYETRVQKVDTNFKVLSENGLTIFVDLTIRFQPQITELARLHREVGPEYVERVVVPEVKAVIRRIFGNYTPEEIYASQAGILQNIQLTAIGALRERFVILDGIMIREIRLPESVAAAIQSKLRQEQMFLEYSFRLKREEEEAKRKAIEARGIADFQREINSGLTPEYLRFRGIEATLRLAESDNAKVVVVGNSEDGLPLILNMESVNRLMAPADSETGATADPNSFREEQPMADRPLPTQAGDLPPPSETLPPISIPLETAPPSQP